MEAKIVWTEKAISSYESILDFLAFTWSEKVTTKFKKLVNEKLIFILNNPKTFPQIQKHKFARKVIIHTNVSLYYDFDEITKMITILFLNDNRQNPSKIKW